MRKIRGSTDRRDISRYLLVKVITVRGPLESIGAFGRLLEFAFGELLANSLRVELHELEYR